MPDEDNLTLSSILSRLTIDHPGEVSALSRLPVEEAAITLRSIIVPTAGLDSDDILDRIAEQLRASVGLTKDDTDGVTILAPAESDRFDEICAAAFGSKSP